LFGHEIEVSRMKWALSICTLLGPCVALGTCGYQLRSEDVDFKVVAVTKRVPKKTVNVAKPVRLPDGWVLPLEPLWNVEVLAEVQKVHETRTGLQPGSRIVIRYYVAEFWPLHPMLRKGECWSAILNVGSKDKAPHYVLWDCSTFAKVTKKE
jgi:hypothetical protein